MFVGQAFLRVRPAHVTAERGRIGLMCAADLADSLRFHRNLGALLADMCGRSAFELGHYLRLSVSLRNALVDFLSQGGAGDLSAGTRLLGFLRWQGGAGRGAVALFLSQGVLGGVRAGVGNVGALVFAVCFLPKKHKLVRDKNIIYLSLALVVVEFAVGPSVFGCEELVLARRMGLVEGMEVREVLEGGVHGLICDLWVVELLLHETKINL